MKGLRFLALLVALPAVLAHGDEEEDYDENTYVIRHMAKEHHITDFDMESFFHLHDLDRNLYLTVDEIEAIYGVHHEISKKHETSRDEETHKQKAELIVSSVLAALDKNGDGMISLEEFVAGGPEGLPDFNALGADGHHYDSESEYFLHHEETHHSTPETQTDEAYVHAEDIEHFSEHEQIEREEENRERKFQGLPPLGEDEEPGHLHEVAAEGEEGAQQVIQQQQTQQEEERRRTRFERNPKDVPVTEKFKGMEAEADKKGEWGAGEAGFKTPKTPADRLRRNLPYKYKFRRNWSDF